MKRTLLLAGCLCIGINATNLWAEDDPPVSFPHDIRPILSDHCFQCHGPDAAQRESALRLDTPDGVFADLGGYQAVVPGELQNSELYRRITSMDSDERMPPATFHRRLSPGQIDLLRRWIEQGATRGEHWSFVAPRLAIPSEAELSRSAGWSRNGIDTWIHSRLHREGIRPSPEASRSRLLRRVTLDLTGLPPSPDQVAAFQADQAPDAFERLVDRLMLGVRYGERMALPWLDAARYADSAGYQSDFRRTQWPWRDWVIDAYNTNLPFDEFTRQQLAGDLLPGSDDNHLLATAFNRNHRINNEGGIIPEEFLVEYVSDRVETTSTVWLGLTVGCARCHDHKYDPITQKDYYRLFAFFNNVPERGKEGGDAPRPNMTVYADQMRARHKTLEDELQDLIERQRKLAADNESSFGEWLKSESFAVRSASRVVLPSPHVHLAFDAPSGRRIENLANAKRPATVGGKARMIQFRTPGRDGNAVFIRSGGYVRIPASPGDSGFSASRPLTWSCWVRPGKDLGNVEGPILSSVTPTSPLRGIQLLLEDRDATQPFRVAFRMYRNRSKQDGMDLVSDLVVARDKYSHVAVSYDGSLNAEGVTVHVNGMPVDTTIRLNRLSNDFSLAEDTLIGAQTESTADTNVRDEELRNSWIDDVVMFSTALSPEQIALLFDRTTTQLILAQKNPARTGRNFLKRSYIRDHVPKFQELQNEISRKKTQLTQFENKYVTHVSVMQESDEPRETYLLKRGAYDHPDRSEKLLPDTFRALIPMSESLPRNRLGLAEWLLDERHPLTARVAVNRYWQLHFGTGLVGTPEDFGSQGSPPTHPRLLDWLAIRFRERAWNIKAMQRLIVSSATYRQQSKVTPALLRMDPKNRLLSRGPRFRLYGQAIRDQALTAAGLLVKKVGGPPVMPYQPAGLWEEVSAKGYKYIQGEGESLYRRSLYTFWRRTVPPPSMMNFDNSSREACMLRTSITNTPLQALNLLNDRTYVEAAAFLARRMILEAGPSPDDQIRHGFRLLLARQPDPDELRVLLASYHNYRDAFTADPEAAADVIDFGMNGPHAPVDPIPLAAASIVAATILNLDETVNVE